MLNNILFKIRKYFERRKHFALIDKKIKSPLLRDLLKTSYAKSQDGQEVK